MDRLRSACGLLPFQIITCSLNYPLLGRISDSTFQDRFSTHTLLFTEDNSTPHTDATKDKNNTIRDPKNETTPHRGIEPRALKEVNRGTVENTTITYAGR